MDDLFERATDGNQETATKVVEVFRISVRPRRLSLSDLMILVAIVSLPMTVLWMSTQSKSKENAIALLFLMVLALFLTLSGWVLAGWVTPSQRPLLTIGIAGLSLISSMGAFFLVFMMYFVEPAGGLLTITTMIAMIFYLTTWE